ncbi:hypothetical protein PSY30_23470, partial [Shigella flexneri]|nr:hypothetical protein [Shigella flexneri]
SNAGVTDTVCFELTQPISEQGRHTPGRGTGSGNCEPGPELKLGAPAEKKKIRNADYSGRIKGAPRNEMMGVYKPLQT